MTCQGQEGFKTYVLNIRGFLLPRLRVSQNSETSPGTQSSQVLVCAADVEAVAATAAAGAAGAEAVAQQWWKQ